MISKKDAEAAVAEMTQAVREYATNLDVETFAEELRTELNEKFAQAFFRLADFLGLPEQEMIEELAAREAIAWFGDDTYSPYIPETTKMRVSLLNYILTVWSSSLESDQ